VLLTHQQRNIVSFSGEHLGKGRTPAATADNGYLHEISFPV
jgi:hypothetical protein